MHGMPHRGIYRNRWYHRPIFFGGGCLNSLFGMVLFPIFLIIFVAMILFSSIGSVFSSLSNRTTVKYDENKFQDYADSQYASEFGTSTFYEDNILLVFLADDKNYSDYYYIAWIGDHIVTDINYMFGNENTELGHAISSSLNTNSYKYSLDTNLSQTIENMKNQITSKNLESSFNCEENHVQVESHLTNKTNLKLNIETINSELKSFTDETGISFVVVMENITDVFSKQIPVQSIITIIILIVLIVLVVYSLTRNKQKKNNINNFYGQSRDYDYPHWEEK